MNEKLNGNSLRTRAPVSAFIICFNEEKHIGECVESLSFCDDIVVIDSFSTDRTPEICASLPVRFIQHPWEGFRGQKSFGLSQTRHEWVVNLDADERVSPELRSQILAVLAREGGDIPLEEGLPDKLPAPEADAYEISRVVYFLQRWWRNGGWYPEFRVRFFRKSKIVWGGVDPHEKPEVMGSQARLEGEILHYTYDDIEAQLKQLTHFAAIATPNHWKAGKRFSILSLLVNPLLRFFKFFFLKKGCREGIAGFIVAVNEAFYTFSKYSLLWEYETLKKPKENVHEKLGERKE